MITCECRSADSSFHRMFLYDHASGVQRLSPLLRTRRADVSRDATASLALVELEVHDADFSYSTRDYRAPSHDVDGNVPLRRLDGDMTKNTSQIGF